MFDSLKSKLKNIFKKAPAEIAEPGDKILLSPACASWDMYPRFEVRGEHFKEIVNKIKDK